MIGLELGSCELELQGVVYPDGKLDLVISVLVTDIQMPVDVDFSGEKLEKDLSSEAELIAFDFNSDDVMYTEIQGNKVLFYAVEDLESLVFTPTIEVSEGATVSPASGTAQDFSKSVTYTITSEDGVVAAVYTAEQAGDVTMFGFEEWTASSGSDPYYEPIGWATSNPANSLLSGVPFPVQRDENSRNGVYCAKIQTQITNSTIAFIPNITAGSLFLGTFSTNILKPKTSTKFGIPYFKKPLKVKGYYKYEPGEVFYDNHTQNDSKKDQLAISAVLYEVEEYTESLTGEDLTTSDKIVAFAQFSNGEKITEYTEFE
ncbi:MAG: PCMD domain-containing protein, partial [Rikenellaceae bacterium]|nr:PCMD domain-containing protein [Rikenellaceae bacterium]